MDLVYRIVLAAVFVVVVLCKDNRVEICPSTTDMSPTPCEDECSSHTDCPYPLVCCPGGCAKDAHSDEKTYKACVYPDICATGVCKNGATCIRSQGLEFDCLCPAGLEGRYCDVDIDECLSQPCQHGGQCIDLLNDYTCCCPPEFTGKSCESENICAARLDPCLGQKCNKYPEATCEAKASFTVVKNGKVKDVTDQCNPGNQ